MEAPAFKYHDNVQADLRTDPMSAGSIIEMETATTTALWASWASL
jgi:hypothetical protein